METLRCLFFSRSLCDRQDLHALLAAKADVNVRDAHHRTPLHGLVRLSATATLLLEARANSLAADCIGQTPLHYAAALGCWDTCHAMLAELKVCCGMLLASPVRFRRRLLGLKDDYGQTPADYAMHTIIHTYDRANLGVLEVLPPFDCNPSTLSSRSMLCMAG